jgi:hypothetical protein
MTSRKKPGVAFWATVAAVTVLVAACGYAGAYLYTVDDMDFVGRPGPIYAGLGLDEYCDQETVKRFFGAAHWIDRRIRRDKWINEPR